MHDVELLRTGARGRGSWSGSLRLTLAVFVVTSFVSAFLLFLIQPMFTKLVLPRLGGSPQVWSVAMCFFQVTLLAGYGLAHLLAKLPRGSWWVGLHVTVLALAALTLPLAVASGFERPPEDFIALWLIALFAVSIGLPFLVLSANAPTLQAWFARTGHPHAADPYFLYGAGNLGSLLALLAYPLLVEPNLSLGDQRLVWSEGFILLIGCVAVAGALMVAQHRAMPISETKAELATVPRPTGRDRAIWTGLAFVPSALLVAVTAHVSTDVASAPFLWVVPLALFLLTFVITFQQSPLIRHRWMLALQPVVTVAMLVMLVVYKTAWMPQLAVHLGGFFVLAMVCHGALVARRPAARHLTEFYLFMALGGALGGVFTSLVAPQLFLTVAEYPLLIVLALFARPGALAPGASRPIIVGAGIAAAIAAALASRPLTAAWPILAETWLPAALVAATLSVALFRRSTLIGRAVAGTSSILFVFVVLAGLNTTGDVHRSFFGVTKVVTTPDGRHRAMLHGTTLHGAQRLEADGPALEPLTYFHHASSMATVIEARRAVAPMEQIAVVGLGTGSLACHSEAGEAWTFFEIDPAVVRIARDPTRFTFLSECAPEARVIVGDARLTLADEQARTFDIIVLDAFSSDAIPTHLLTREAIQGYLSKLAPRGVLALHVMNRHVDIAPAVAAVAQDLRLHALHGVSPGVGDVAHTFKLTSHTVALAREADSLGDLAAHPDWAPLPHSAWPVWTDDYAHILQALLAKVRDR